MAAKGMLGWGGGKNWVKRNRKKPPGSKYRKLARPEELESRAAPSDSLIALMAIAEGLRTSPLLPPSEVCEASEVSSFVDHYISGEPTPAVWPAVPAAESLPQVCDVAALSDAAVDTLLQTEATVGRAWNSANFDFGEALRERADALADHFLSLLPALGAFPFGNPGGDATDSAGMSPMADSMAHGFQTRPTMAWFPIRPRPWPQ